MSKPMGVSDRSLAQGEQFISYIMVRMNKFFYETMMVSGLS
jgi:hypothetical protein